jgi:hypothetical protein
VFGAKGSKGNVDLMTVPHRGSTNNMGVKWNYPVNATNIIVCSGDGGIKYSTTMADGTIQHGSLRTVQRRHRLLHDGEVPHSLEKLQRRPPDQLRRRWRIQLGIQGLLILEQDGWFSWLREYSLDNGGVQAYRRRLVVSALDDDMARRPMSTGKRRSELDTKCT